MASYLNSAGLAHAHGFSLNVSSFYTVAQNVAYGNAINADLSSWYGYTKPFVIDTSRDGNGSNGDQLQPRRERRSATDQVGGGADALLWIKSTRASPTATAAPVTAPSPVQFNPQLAYDLVYGY